MVFQYLKEGSLLEDAGTVHRILEVAKDEWLLKVNEADGSPKFHEVTFGDWSFPAEWKVDGVLTDPEYGVLDSGTGEPIVVEQPPNVV
mgnify:CR=1 FL=1